MHCTYGGGASNAGYLVDDEARHVPVSRRRKVRCWCTRRRTSRSARCRCLDGRRLRRSTEWIHARTHAVQGAARIKSLEFVDALSAHAAASTKGCNQVSRCSIGIMN
ncbi:hypothetical protein GQ55_9G016600 [Panicum hallii var. hallii]|uniref:Uncharacterized protein n=1 Tax=Panicum hallii var. hallii TaxID=1504633 RepID=A0A2T7BYI6_9POAL|nr:hypothetical protein GQ55_9G016600 [Panicum hallii var. hallii]